MNYRDKFNVASLYVKVKVCPIYDQYVGEFLLERHLY